MQGNPNHPLPADYYTLSQSGQRLARRAAIITKQTDPPEKLVWAWSFLRSHYLLSLPPGIWHKPPIYPSPLCHYQFIYDLARYPRTIKIMPRSFAKSTLIEEFLLTLCYGRSPFKALVIRASDDFIKASFTRLMQQIQENELLLADFGNIVPRRNQVGIWSKSRLHLRNGFELIGRSVMGKLLGIRPNLVICDDAEFDTSMRVSPAQLTENFRLMWYNSVIPMLDYGCSAALVGTLFNRKLFIYEMATTPISEEPSLAYWLREVLAVVDSQTGKSTWPEKFPMAKIVELMEALPPEIFAAQYMNNPRTGAEQTLIIDKKCGYYRVVDPDSAYMSSTPLDSKSVIITSSPDKVTGRPAEIIRPFGEAVSHMYRVLLADPIKKPSMKSDHACVLVVGIERSKYFQDVWWLLDIRLGRPSHSEFLKWIWELGARWNVKLCGVEAIGVQKDVADQAAQFYVRDPSIRSWSPRVYPINYRRDYSGDLGKANRIASLAWRFENNKIKLPSHLILNPGWRELMEQITNFTRDLALLQYDDAIDTLAMTNFIGKSRKRIIAPDSAPPTISEALASGEEFIPGTKYPILMAANLDKLTPEQLAGLDQIKARQKPPTRGGRSRKPRHKGTHYGNPV